MTALRDALATYLHDWRDDVPAAWLPVLEGVEPALDKVKPHLELREPLERIHPLRKGHNDSAAPAGSHPFKALESVLPQDVRVVLVGQDPYPNIANATGRSFEQGGRTRWESPPKPKLAISLQRIVQVLAEHRQPGHAYASNDAAWIDWLQAFTQNKPAMQLPHELFDHWGQQGVLCLNLGLTLSRFDDKDKDPEGEWVQPAHMALWTPVVQRILEHLVCRPQQALLLMLWGEPAQDAVDAMGLKALAAASGDARRLLEVRKQHPNARANGSSILPFFRPRNPFTLANELLADEGFSPIDW